MEKKDIFTFKQFLRIINIKLDFLNELFNILEIEENDYNIVSEIINQENDFYKSNKEYFEESFIRFSYSLEDIEEKSKIIDKFEERLSKLNTEGLENDILNAIEFEIFIQEFLNVNLFAENVNLFKEVTLFFNNMQINCNKLISFYCKIYTEIMQKKRKNVF